MSKKPITPPPPPPMPEAGSRRKRHPGAGGVHRAKRPDEARAGIRPRSPVEGDVWRPDKDAEVDFTAVDPRQRAKLVGMLAYVRAGSLSLHDVWQQTPLDSLKPDGLCICDVVHFRQFRGWAHTGRWTAERDKLWADIEQRALKAVAGQAVKQELAEVHGLEQLRVEAEVQLRLAEPKSFEGMLRAMLALDQRISDKRSAIAESVAKKVASGERAVTPSPEGAAASASTAGPLYEDGLSEADVVAMAKAVLAQRVGAMPTDEGEDDDDGL